MKFALNARLYYCRQMYFEIVDYNIVKLLLVHKNWFQSIRDSNQRHYKSEQIITKWSIAKMADHPSNHHHRPLIHFTVRGLTFLQVVNNFKDNPCINTALQAILLSFSVMFGNCSYLPTSVKFMNLYTHIETNIIDMVIAERICQGCPSSLSLQP